MHSRTSSTTLRTVATACVGLFILTAATATTAHAAQPPLPPEPAVPKGTTGVQAPASTGTTELQGDLTFQTAKDPNAAATPDADCIRESEATIQAGGQLVTGNSRALLSTLRADGRVRRGRHQVEATIAGNYGGGWNKTTTETVDINGATTTTSSDKYDETTKNLQGRVRYDAFLNTRWALFAMATGRHDPFQSLDLRANGDVGVAFFLLTDEKQRMWFEAGVDVQHDIVTPKAIREAKAALLTDPTVEVPNRTKTFPASRLFAGYSNSLNEAVTFKTGLEYLQRLGGSDDLKDYRLNWDNSLAVQLVGNLSISLTATLRYESRQVEPQDFKNLDTITALNLMYRFK